MQISTPAQIWPLVLPAVLLAVPWEKSKAAPDTAAPKAVVAASPAATPGKGQVRAASTDQDKKEGEWVPLFDGKTMEGWARTPFGGGGDVQIEGGTIQIEQGEELSGFHFAKPFSKADYEISLEAKRLSGLDFFCGLTFPVATPAGERHLSFIVGGWGGAVVGISSINKMDASTNETSKTRTFEDNRWYRIRVRVEKERLQAWIDEEQMVNVDTRGKDLDLRAGEIELSKPMGLATFRTSAAFRNIRVRNLQPVEGK